MGIEAEIKIENSALKLILTAVENFSFCNLLSEWLSSLTSSCLFSVHRPL